MPLLSASRSTAIPSAIAGCDPRLKRGWTFREGLPNEHGFSYSLSYPCAMLNHLVHAHFTNDQYQELVNADEHIYEQVRRL